jgi:hypothetical protein
MAKSMKPGGGGRFMELEGKLEGEGKSKKAAGAIAAAGGDKKYGKKKMEGWAKKGKKKAGW